MTILQQVVPFSCTLLPPPSPAFPLLPPSRAFVEQKQRRALPAPQMPKIVGYLPAPCSLPFAIKPEVFGRKGSGDEGKSIKRVVVAEIVNPLDLIDIRRDPHAWWEEFERIHGKIKTIEELDAEIEAEHPGYLAWAARMRQYQQAKAEAAAS